MGDSTSMFIPNWIGGTKIDFPRGFERGRKCEHAAFLLQLFVNVSLRVPPQ